MLADLFFDWLAHRSSELSLLGGVLDSISDWSALLPFESERSLANLLFKKTKRQLRRNAPSSL